MTREERATDALSAHLGHSSGLLSPIMWLNVRQAMLAFADAEAAAMRERAAGVALEHVDGARHLHNAASKDSDRDGRLVHGEGWRTARSIWAAIRALPTTEVGNG